MTEDNDDNDNNDNNDSDDDLAYCHLVGLGLGVWTLHGFQDTETRQFVQCVRDIIENTNLPNIGAIDFSWFDPSAEFRDDKNKTPVFEYDETNDCYYCFDASKTHKIDIIFSKRSAAELLHGKYLNYNLCAMYAWNGNSLPGSGYYMGSLTASGDHAAAACSTIPFIQNSEINKEYINGNNTCVYFRDSNDLTKYKRFMLKDLYENVKFEEWEQWAIDSHPYRNHLKQKNNNNGTIDLKQLLME